MFEMLKSVRAGDVWWLMSYCDQDKTQLLLDCYRSEGSHVRSKVPALSVTAGPGPSDPSICELWKTQMVINVTVVQLHAGQTNRQKSTPSLETLPLELKDKLTHSV